VEDGPPPAIEIAGLARRHGERLALSGVSLAVPAGASLAVFGANGAGKSTLLRVLASLLRPHAGTVRVLGEELPGRAWKVRGRVGFAGHEPLLYRALSGRENLTYHARLHRVALERVEEVLEQSGMRARAADPVRTLSRGMVQRLAVCRAVLHDPAVLLLDEPRANLDPAGAESLAPLLAGRTRVLTSHDPARGLAGADLALGLRRGKMAWLAPAADVSEADVEELYA
jgi:heme exporter protein A